MREKSLTLDEWEARRQESIRRAKSDEIGQRNREREQLENDVKLLKDALSFYADKRNYLADVEDDFGHIAREALKQTEHDID